MKTIKIIIADDVLEMRDMIIKMLEHSVKSFEIVATCENGKEVLDVLSKKQTDIVLMDINMPIMNGIEATEEIAKLYPEINVVMMSVQHESEYLKKAMFAGAKAYIMKPLEMDELIETLVLTYEKYQNNFVGRRVPLEASHKGKIISFFSAKGGVGKTFLALNAAISLAKVQKLKTLLIDLDLRFGDLSLMVNKQNELTIKELFDEDTYQRFEDISPFITTYSEGVDLILAPKEPTFAEYINAEQIKALLKAVKPYYDIILIDTGVNYDDVTLCALDLSDQIMMVSSIEVTGLKNTKISLKVMQSLNYTESKIKLVMNMVQDKFGVTKGQIEKAFNYEVIAYFPEEVKLVRHSINSGTPVSGQKNNALMKSFQKLCKTLAES